MGQNREYRNKHISIKSIYNNGAKNNNGGRVVFPVSGAGKIRYLYKKEWNWTSAVSITHKSKLKILKKTWTQDMKMYNN